VKRRHRQAWTAASILTLAPFVYGVIDHLTPWWVARSNHARFEQDVRECEEVGRRWFRGDCIDPTKEAP
jgi:hypothetical protein